MNDRLHEVWFLTSELESERASSFRQERWCRIFIEAGASLRIFNLRGAFEHSNEVCSDMQALLQFRQDGVARYRGPQASVREGWLVRLLRRLKHFLLADLYLPNVIKLYRCIDALICERVEPVVLMASSPPFSLALVGALVKRRHPAKVIFVVDMRDAWALHNALGGLRSLKRFIERHVLRCADHVTTVSNGLAEEFRRFYNIDVRVMYNVATHYLDVPQATQIDLRQVNGEINPKKITLAYTGSTPEHHYDLAAILDGLVRLIQERPVLGDRLQLIFVGACDEVRREAQIRGLGAPYIVFVQHLPHSIARSVQASASALIFLAHHGPNNLGVVSTKLFEYLCLGQPVLPLDLCKGSDVDLLLRRYCGTSINAHGEVAVFDLLVSVAEHGIEKLPKLDEPQRVLELLAEYRQFANSLLIVKGNLL